MQQKHSQYTVDRIPRLMHKDNRHFIDNCSISNNTISFCWN